MQVRKMFGCLAAVSCLVLAVTACQPEAKATGGDGPEGADKGRKFSIQVSSLEVKSGASGAAVVTFKPGDGYKWNLEYPAKLTFKTKPTKVALSKTRFQQLKGDFKASDKVASVDVPVTAREAGEETLAAEAKFSVCNETTCLIEKAAVEVAVKVVP